MLFSTPMVWAILDGTKTQTRRLIKPQPLENTSGYLYKGTFWGFGEIIPKKMIQYAPYKPGDILWVRETWSDFYFEESGYIYEADEDRVSDEFRWKSSTHMPRKAARIFLEVKSVRVERLQDITEEDARAEGIKSYLLHKEHGGEWRERNGSLFWSSDYNTHSTRKEAFSELWDSLNAKRGYSWESNPWVWVIEFARIKKPIKQ